MVKVELYGSGVRWSVGSTVVDQRTGLWELLTARNWDREQLAAESGVSRRTVEGWFQGRAVGPRGLLGLLRILGDSD